MLFLRTNNNYHKKLSGFSDNAHSLFLKWSKSRGQHTVEPLRQIDDSHIVGSWLRRVAPASSTCIRKYITMEGRNKNPEAATALAGHLCHSVRTANRYYDISTRERAAPEIQDLVDETLGTGGTLDSQWSMSEVIVLKLNTILTLKSHCAQIKYHIDIKKSLCSN